MRASVFIATSLDGYIARQNGELDWLPADGELSDGEDHGYWAFMATVDMLVIGRHTFEKVLTFGRWPYGEKPVVVLTSKSSGLPSATRCQRGVHERYASRDRRAVERARRAASLR